MNGKPNTQKSIIDYGEGDTPLEECLDCGAHALNGKDITHYSSCTPGEAEKWEAYYKEENELK